MAYEVIVNSVLVFAKIVIEIMLFYSLRQVFEITDRIPGDNVFGILTRKTVCSEFCYRPILVQSVGLFSLHSHPIVKVKAATLYLPPANTTITAEILFKYLEIQRTVLW